MFALNTTEFVYNITEIDHSQKIKEAHDLIYINAEQNFKDKDFQEMFDNSKEALSILDGIKSENSNSLYPDAYVYCGIAYSYLHPELFENVGFDTYTTHNTYYKEAINIYDTFNEEEKQSGYGWVYQSIGDNYSWQEKWDQALDYYLLALKARYDAKNTDKYVNITKNSIKKAYKESGREELLFENWLEQAKSNGYKIPY